MISTQTATLSAIRPEVAVMAIARLVCGIYSLVQMRYLQSFVFAHGFGHKKRASTQPRAKGRINALCNHIKLRMHLWEMHPYFLNKTPCFNLLDLLTSDLRHIAGDTYKVCFEKVLTFMLRSYFGLKVDKISENPMF